MNKPICLIIAILIPIFMIIMTAFLTTLNRSNFIPQRHFIYGFINKDDKLNCVKQIKSIVFSAETNEQKNNEVFLQCKEPDFYLYDVKSDSNKKITLAEVKKWISPVTSTSDGFTISEYCDSSRVLGWGIFADHYYSPVCLRKENYTKRLEINIPSFNEDKSFFFIGWTTVTRNQ